MAATYLIGIDIGSSFTKSTVVDTDGTILADAKRDTHPDQPRAGVAEYDGPKLLRAVYDSTRELVQQSGIAPEDVAAVCLDGMISGTLGIDEDGDATTPYTTTLDTRFFPQLNWTLENFHDPIRRLGVGAALLGRQSQRSASAIVNCQLSIANGQWSEAETL